MTATNGGQRRPRIAIGCIIHETNSFSRRPTRLEDFQSRYLLTGADLLGLAGTNSEIAGFLDAADAQGWEVVPLLAASCGPSGPLTTGEWQELCNRLVQAMEQAGLVDGVLFGLHGAMMVEGDRDADGTLLSMLRSAFGTAPLVATLDMHANVSPLMVDRADALITYRAYPHVDQRQTGQRAGAVLAKYLGRGRPAAHLRVQPPLLDSAAHGRTNPPGPMNELLALARQAESQPGVDAVNLQIGFPWGDSEFTGPSVVVSGSDKAAAKRIAEEFAARFMALTDSVEMDFPDAATAVHEALAAPPGKPVVLADFADNPSAGAYGDSPNLLRALVEARAHDAVFAPLFDPESAEQAHMLGKGAVAEFHLGGRWTPDITPALTVKARVDCLSDGRFVCEGPMAASTTQSLGRSALLSIAGVRVIVASRPLAAYDRNLLRLFGVEPAEARILALKSRNHCRAAFGPIAQSVTLVDAGGIASMRLHELPFEHVRRPVWPLDDLSQVAEHTT